MFLFKYYGLKEICYRIDNFQNCECQKKNKKKMKNENVTINRY